MSKIKVGDIIRNTFDMIWTYQQFDCFVPPLEKSINQVFDPLLQALDNIYKYGDDYSQKMAAQALREINIYLDEK